MRLLGRDESTGNIRLTDFLPGKAPAYAILSHTWGSDDEEVSYKDLVEGTGDKKAAGYRKIRFCEEQALKADHLKYFWVDTCCINKSSSAELQESINRMFQWYRDASKCYVFLADVSKPASDNSDEASPEWESAFRKSRWFTRGWTLQELIAPKSVEFFSKEGVRLGDKSSLERQIHEITRIPVQVLRGRSVTSFTVEERKSWVQGRETAREEDQAYSLFGLFDVQMPLLYGEGQEKAFKRLEQEISKAQNNIFAEEPDAQACLRDLFLVDPSEDKNALKRKIGGRAQGTCQWILDTEELAMWLDGAASAKTAETNSILWLHGNPGAGKSTLSIFLAEALHDRFSAENDKSLAYFFCDSSFDKRRTATAILRGLIWQLVDQQRQLLKHIVPLYIGRGKSLFESFDALWKIFTKITADRFTGQKYCIIDALDECDREAQNTLLHQLQHTFEDQSAERSSGIRILITSRPDQNIVENLGRFTNRALTSYPESAQDVEHFIDVMVADLKIRKKYTKRVEEQVRQTLRRKAAGSFLWVGIACRELGEVGSSRAMKVLEGLPKRLRELYDKLLDTALRSKNEDRGIIKRILSCVAVAVRPLSLSELEEACDLYPEEDEDTRAQFTREHIAACRHLVVIQDERVLFLHKSVADYLTSSFIDELDAHADFAYRCIDVLIEELGGIRDGQFIRLSTDFAEYAAERWVDHAHMAQQRFIVKDAQEDFLKVDSPSRQQWLRYISNHFFILLGRHIKDFSILHIAGQFGIPALFDYVSRTDDSLPLDCYDAGNNTPLDLALKSGHRELVCKLLDAGAMVTKRSIEASAKSWDAGALQLLLDRLGNKIITDAVVCTAAGNKVAGDTIMRLLLGRLGDKIITAGVVRAAAGNRNGADTMRLLLDRLGDNIITSEAVCAAAENSKEVLALLLGQRGNQIITDEVVCAAARNKRDTMRLLLEWRKDPIIITEEVVIAASSNSFGGLIMLLLLQQTGVRISVTEKMVALIVGCHWFGEDVARLFFDQRANEIALTEKVVTTVAEDFDCILMSLLLDQYGSQFKINEAVLRAAARNEIWGTELMTLLLERREKEIVITDEVIKAVMANDERREEMITLLLERRRDEFVISRQVVETELAPMDDAEEIIAFLLQKGRRAAFTEDAIAFITERFGEEVMALETMSE